MELMSHRLVAAGLFLLVAACPLHGDTIVTAPGFAGGVPIDESFRYPGHDLFAHLHADLNDVVVGIVGPNTITMADAVRAAMLTWNVALGLSPQDPNWNWVETNVEHPNSPLPHIHFRMSRMLPNGDEELEEPDDVYSEIDGPGGAAGANTLAFFRILTQCGDCVFEAEIVFNRLAPWGIAGAAFYDPIIVALHEMGHAMRLDHYTDPNDRTINGNGVVMRPILAAGVHSTNPTLVGNALFPRFPSQLDIDAATVSAQLAEPCPEPACVLSLMAGMVGLTALRRRRARHG
jgi:hypothetical protein